MLNLHCNVNLHPRHVDEFQRAQYDTGPVIHFGTDVAENTLINLGMLLQLQTPWEILSDLEVCKDNNKGNTNTISTH
jgi:hypothetical protein